MPALPLAGDADNGDDAGAELFLAFVHQALEVLQLDALDRAREELDVADDRTPSAPSLARAAAHRELFLRVGQFAFEPAALIQNSEPAGRACLQATL